MDKIAVVTYISLYYLTGTPLQAENILPVFVYLASNIDINGSARKSGLCYINTRVISPPMGYNSLQISIKFGFPVSAVSAVSIDHHR